MTNEELRAYRTKLFRDAGSMKVKPDRIPNMSFCVTWKILDAGYKLTEAMNDYTIMEKVVREHQEKYEFDALFEHGVRNVIRLPLALGGLTYNIDDEAGAVSYVDNALCDLDELDELIADPNKFFWEKGMAKKYPMWADKTVGVEDMQKVIMEFGAFSQYNMKMLKVLPEEYGLPTNTAPSQPPYQGLDFLFNTILGIKGLSMAMRRCPDKVEEAVHVLNELYLTPSLKALEAMPDGPFMDACFDYDITLLCNSILNNKQFERFLWPDLKAMLDLLEKKGKTTRLFMEGDNKRFWEYFADYKPGTIVLHADQDDVFELKKALPNVAIMGGMKLETLGRGTKEECLSLTKKLCDELGSEGGYIFSENAMVSYKNDCNPENLKAVCDFVREYRP